MVFGVYSRVQAESDDEEPSARDASTHHAGAQAQPAGAGAQVLKSGSQFGLSQPNVVQRGAAPSAGAAASTSGKASTVGNLIDFGESEDLPTSSKAAADKSKRKTSKQQVEQVELVTIVPTDPFDFLIQQRTAQPAQQQQQQQPPAPSQQEGYDPLQGPGHRSQQQQADSGDGDAAGSSGQGGGGFASFPFFGSFGDLAGASQQAQQQPLSSHQSQRHSHSANDISDLLQLRQAEQEGGGTSGRGAHGTSSAATYQAPHVIGADRSSSAAAAVAAASGAAGDADGGGASRASASAPGSGTATPSYDADGEPVGHPSSTKELYLYAVPLFKDKLVFLPVVNWKETQDTSTVMGKVGAGVSSVGTNISSMWHSLKDKEPGSLQHKIYRAGQAIMENMNAEERLMRNIPKKANKLVIRHPASIPPDEVQDQLTALTSSFCVKSAGKAAVAGVMLPVAVGLEVLFVPGIGWYTAYQLFKSTSAAAGGSRLNQYLKKDKSEVRICYNPDPKLDIYILKARLSPDSILGTEDIEDLVHDVKEPSLAHPLLELRSRQLKKTQTMNADYALLPMNPNDNDDLSSASSASMQPAAKKHA